jgi:hypothetical protein
MLLWANRLIRKMRRGGGCVAARNHRGWIGAMSLVWPPEPSRPRLPLRSGVGLHGTSLIAATVVDCVRSVLQSAECLLPVQ